METFRVGPEGVAMRLLLAIAALSSACSAQTLTYTFTGVVSGGSPTQGPFAGFDLGDTFTATVGFDPSNPDRDDPDSRSWDDEAIASYLLEIDGQVFDLMTLNGTPSFRGAEVEDDSPVEGDDHDYFSLYVAVPFAGVVNARFETYGPSGSVISSLSGTDAPTAEELDPSRWGSADMIMGTGSANRLVGTIQSVTVVPGPSASIALALGVAGAGLRRRR